MDKNQLLDLITTFSAQSLATKEEILVAYEKGRGKTVDSALTRHLDLSEILYYLGGAIVFLGIAILVFQNWSTLNPLTRILLTLGSGISAYIVGFLFSRYEHLNAVGHSFYLVSGLLMPIGLNVTIDAFDFEVSGSGVQTMVSLILLITYASSYFILKKTIFILFSIVFGTLLFFSLTSFLLGGSPLIADLELNEYRILITGLVYILLGYSFSQTNKLPLTGPLYGFGVLGLLGATLALGGWGPSQNIFWELVFPIVVFGVIFSSVHLKSKSFLVFGTMFLMVYIIKITAGYFADSLGWPIALVFAGLMLIGVGYLAFYLNKKYLSQAIKIV